MTVCSLKKNFVVPALALAIAGLAQAQGAAPTKIGIIHVQAAILQTKDGQKAAADLKNKFAPRQSSLEKKQAEIQTLQDQLRKGSATMSDDDNVKITRDIDNNTKALNRDSQDLQTDVEEEEQKIYNDLGAKMYAIVEKYAKDNGYSMIIDVSVQPQPVWWASDAINITNDAIGLYDKAHPAGAATSSAAPATAPSTTPAGAPPRATPPPAARPAGAPAAPAKK